MKVFLDTNVLVSAIATRGLCSDIFRTVLLEHQMIVSGVVLSELNRVLQGKLKLPAPLISDYIKLLNQYAVFIESSRNLDLDLRDPSDLPVLSSAYFGGAEVFITGDSYLQSLTSVFGLKILSPRQFWEIIRIDIPGKQDR